MSFLLFHLVSFAGIWLADIESDKSGRYVALIADKNTIRLFPIGGRQQQTEVASFHQQQLRHHHHHHHHHQFVIIVKFALTKAITNMLRRSL